MGNEDILKQLLEDKEALLKFYKSELRELIKRFEDLKPTLDEIQRGIMKKQEMIAALDKAAIKNNEPETSISGLPQLKWRQEVFFFLNFSKERATAVEIGDKLISQYNIENEEDKKELKNKVAITCAGLYRDGKLDRIQENGSDYIYFKISENEIFNS